MGVESRRERGGEAVLLPPLHLHQRRIRLCVASRRDSAHKVLLRRVMGEDVVSISHNFNLLVLTLLRL
jgi:hypothetical protein